MIAVIGMIVLLVVFVLPGIVLVGGAASGVIESRKVKRISRSLDSAIVEAESRFK